MLTGKRVHKGLLALFLHWTTEQRAERSQWSHSHKMGPANRGGVLATNSFIMVSLVVCLLLHLVSKGHCEDPPTGEPRIDIDEPLIDMEEPLIDTTIGGVIIATGG